MRIHPELERLLDESGFAWSLESRKRHRVVVLNGRVVQALSRGTALNGRCHRNAMAHVRRCIEAERQNAATASAGQ